MPHLRLIGRRLLQAVPSLLAVSVVSFLMLRLAPGDPARVIAGPRATEQTVAALGGGATLTPEFDVLYSGNYLLSATAPNVVQSAYAKVDARLTYRTESGLSIQAFVQNLTDKTTIGRITTGTLSAQGTYSDPRTYGVRLGYKF